jgi:hypothetical protein
MKTAGIVLKQIIKNGDIAICKECAYFKPHSTQWQLGKCMKFGEKNLVSGRVTYLYANETRSNEHLCGPNGLYFIKDQRKSEI